MLKPMLTIGNMRNKRPRGVPEQVETMAGETSARFIRQLEVKMENRNITRAELARQMGVSRAAVSRIFTGSPNLTILTMAALADALNCELVLDVRRRRPSLPPLRLEVPEKN